MLTNPYLSLNNSGLKLPNNKLWSVNGNVYSLSIIPSISGTASSDAMIGTENYQTNLYVTPVAGTTLSGWNVTGGTVSNNVFTFGNSDATVEPVFEEQRIQQHTYPLMQLGSEYGWQLPIDVLLDASNNELSIDISFYTNVSDSTTWEPYFYIVKPGNKNDYKRLVEENDCRPIVVSAGYRECNITNTQIVNGLTQTIKNWLNDLRSQGFNYIFTHPASFGTSKFIGEPSATFNFAGDVPRFNEATINDVTWTKDIINIDDGLSGIDKRTNVTIKNHNFGDVYYYNFDAAKRIADSIEGYHLPTKAETDAMVQYIGGYNSTVATKLKSTLYWGVNGSDLYGFMALPLGMIDHGSPSYGTESTFWNDNNGATNRMYITNNNNMANGTENQNNYKYPLRLVKD